MSIWTGLGQRFTGVAVGGRAVVLRVTSRRTFDCLRGFAVQCVAHRVVARRQLSLVSRGLGSLHTVNSGENSNPSTALSGQSMIVVAHFGHILIHLIAISALTP